MIMLYRIDETCNMRCFYHLRIERTLFDHWVLVREWGWIGARGGQVLEQLFDTWRLQMQIMRCKSRKLKKARIQE